MSSKVHSSDRSSVQKTLPFYAELRQVLIPLLMLEPSSYNQQLSVPPLVLRAGDNPRAATIRFCSSAVSALLRSIYTMGIPGLASQLHKYGSYISIPQRKIERHQQAVAIIDGPSLAHSLLGQGKFETGKDGVVPHCDYQAIGRAAIAWLDNLRSYGFDM